VLDKYAGGMQNYVCFQGYIPNCCCMDTSDMCRGSELGLCLEGCCCPVFSISIARLHLMDSKRIRPDPWDYQIIAFSNCLQLASCILDIIAIFVEEVRGLPSLAANEGPMTEAVVPQARCSPATHRRRRS